MLWQRTESVRRGNQSPCLGYTVHRHKYRAPQIRHQGPTLSPLQMTDISGDVESYSFLRILSTVLDLHLGYSIQAHSDYFVQAWDRMTSSSMQTITNLQISWTKWKKRPNRSHKKIENVEVTTVQTSTYEEEMCCTNSDNITANCSLVKWPWGAQNSPSGLLLLRLSDPRTTKS